MSLNTNLKGRVRNINLPKSNILFPLFETVVNSIHAIDEKIDMDNHFKISDGDIKIKIIRSSQLITTKEKSEIIGFEIIDNGIGFNKINYNSFQTLDTEYKLNLGGKGVGRLLWLKAFSKVSINSYYQENKVIYNRMFNFTIAQDIHNEKNEKVSVSGDLRTSVTLLNLLDGYKDYLPKSINAIANALFEHCLWYFLREGGVYYSPFFRPRFCFS
ncbi:MAG: hypothetical protein M0Q51_01800 [Bacteroidales bacterium]|nr:hypothetical protein [Bacteroidales bacterium]